MSTVYHLLPTYLVLDTSASMTESGAFDAAFNFVPKILAEMNKSSSVQDKLRLEVLSFDEVARVELSLSDKNGIEAWLDSKIQDPIEPDGNRTNYSVAFDLLLERINIGCNQIAGEKYPGMTFQPYRPAVFFITDGAPNDKLDIRTQSYASLTNANFKMRPNIICVGVGDATIANLKPYAAGAFNTDSNQYTTQNASLALVARDGVAPTKALEKIIPALIQSIISSLGTASLATPDKDGVLDPLAHMTEDMLFSPDVFACLEDE